MKTLLLTVAIVLAGGPGFAQLVPRRASASLVVYYASWCARPFFLTPSLEFGRDVPDELHAAVSKWWRRNQDAITPERFHFRRFLYLLAHPHRTRPRSVFAQQDDEDEAGLQGLSSRVPMNVIFYKDLEGPGWFPKITYPVPRRTTPSPFPTQLWEKMERTVPIPGNTRG